MVHLSSISYEGRLDVMNMVVSREIELKRLKPQIDKVVIQEMIRWKLCSEAKIKAWSEFKDKYPVLANPDFTEMWYPAVKILVSHSGRKTRDNVRSIEFPQAFMDKLAATFGAEKKLNMYRQVHAKIWNKLILILLR